MTDIRARLDVDSHLFLQALHQPMDAQKNVLESILKANQCSQFGRRYQFSRITSIEDYQKYVPIQSYDAIVHDIKQMLQGEETLFSEPVVGFEATGGSSGGEKIIPWNASTLESLRNGINPWLADLLQYRPKAFSGSCYWSISPAGKVDSPSHDIMFFGSEVAAWLESKLAVPLEVSTSEDMEEWAYWTILYLIKAKDLSFISVWSPTFILQLIRKLSDDYLDFVDDIATGNLAYPIPSALRHIQVLEKPDPVRAAAVRQAVEQKNMHKLWPQLELISCWTDATSALFIGELVSFFLDVEIQGKGLLATEGMVSVPLTQFSAPVLAVSSAFYEFIDQSGNVFLADQLKKGEIYSVVITTFAGLYRYDLGDKVCMKGLADKTPMLQFIGRDRYSDICGEKLSEDFVQSCLEGLKGFSMLLPLKEAKSKYLLLLEGNEYLKEEADKAGKIVEERLLQNPQYAYARSLSQLGAVSVIQTDDLLSRFIMHAKTKGQLLGDIKPPCLYCSTDWQEWVY